MVVVVVVVGGGGGGDGGGGGGGGAIKMSKGILPFDFDLGQSSPAEG